jgi:methylated-DNA-protein-cysteine methyltransferase-like protein
MTPFSQSVIRLIKAIPKGKVATYGQIAALADNPRGSRGVSWILNSSSKAHGLPWQRVMNSKGKISFPWGTKEHVKQKALLMKEGVEVSHTGVIDLKKYGWKKKKIK